MGGGGEESWKRERLQGFTGGGGEGGGIMEKGEVTRFHWTGGGRGEESWKRERLQGFTGRGGGGGGVMEKGEVYDSLIGRMENILKV